MPKLTFLQLAKIFAAGFFGYALLISVAAVGIALLFPSFVKNGPLDMSIHNFLHEVFYYLGGFGIIATLLMLPGAWCILRLFRSRS